MGRPTGTVDETLDKLDQSLHLASPLPEHVILRIAELTGGLEVCLDEELGEDDLDDQSL